MATSKPSIASAYVQILPSTEGIGAGIAGALTGSAVTGAASSAGSIVGGAFGGSMAAAASAALPIGAAVAATGAVVGFGKAAVKTGMEFDSAMSQVYMLMSSINDGAGLTERDMNVLRDRAREMGSTTQFTAEQVADAMSYMALAGWDVQKVYDNLPAVLNLAASSSMDLGRASDIVTDYMAAFSNTSPDAIELVDLLAYAQSRSNATTEQFAQSWQYAAPMMNAFGQSAQTTTAILARLANQGHKSSTAGVELNAVMTALVKEMDKNGDIQFAGMTIHLAEITDGWDAEAVAAEVSRLNTELEGLEEGSPEYLEKVAELTEFMSSNSGHFRNLLDVFGDMETALNASGIEANTPAYMNAMTALFGNVRGMRGIQTILNGDVQEMREFESALYGASGTAERMAGVVNDNLAGDLRILNSALDDLKIAISDSLTPVIRDFVQAITPVIQWLAERVSGETPLGEAAREVEQLDQEDWEGIGRRIEECMDTLYSREATPEEKRAASQYLQEQMGIIANMDWSGTGADAVAGICSGMTHYNFRGDASALLGNMQGAIDAEFGINSPATSMIPTGEYIAAGLGEGMDTYSWQDTAEKIANGIAAAVKNQRGTVGSAGGSLISTIKDRMRNLIGFNGSGFNSLGSDIAQGIADGLLNGTFAVTAAIQQLIDDAVQAARDEAGIFSPSRVFAEEVGQPIAAGIGKGITDNAFEAMDALTGTMNMLTSATAAQFSGAGSMPARAAYVFNQTVNSPRALTPWEIARQARNATRQMAEAMA